MPEKTIYEMRERAREREPGVGGKERERERVRNCNTNSVIFCLLFLNFHQILNFLEAETVPNLFMIISPEPSRARHVGDTQQINIRREKT